MKGWASFLGKDSSFSTKNTKKGTERNVDGKICKSTNDLAEGPRSRTERNDLKKSPALSRCVYVKWKMCWFLAKVFYFNQTKICFENIFQF